MKPVYETINDYRVFPRLVLFVAGAFCWHISQWFTTLQVPTAEQAGYAGSVALACIGIFKYYFENKK